MYTITHENLTAFKQHGFAPKRIVSESQAQGDCPFCGGRDKFFVNVPTKQWDCKVCGEAGGYKVFLKTVHTVAIGSGGGVRLSDLSADRDISLSTFERFSVGLFPATGKYILPVQTGGEYKDLKMYDGHKLISTAGAEVALYNVDDLHDLEAYDTIWLCEGHWDTMVMWEILQALDMKRDRVVGVPGTLVFRPEWSIHFKNKTVKVIYDYDHDREVRGRIITGAGTLGMQKVYRLLQSCARDVRFIHWPENSKSGYDLRDFYRERDKSSSRVFRGLRKMLQLLPPQWKVEGAPEIKGSKYKGEGRPAEEVHKVYKKWLHLTDVNVIDVMYGSIIANRRDGDPIWLFIVAKSGDAKSVFITSLSHAPGVITTTSLTPHALISGFGTRDGGDPSLIPRLKNKVLAIKDFTTILNQNPVARDEIFGILRDIYDGKTEKIFGNGIIRSYDGIRFGFLAGVTPAIELYTEGHTALGERFLRYRMKADDDLQIERMLCRKAMDNTDHEAEMERELKDTGSAVLDFDFSGIEPEVPPDIKEKIISLAQWTAIVRGTINRDKYSREVTHKPFCERPTRLTKQFYKEILGIAQFRRIDKVGIEEYNIIRDMAIGTVPSRMEDIIKKMFKADYTGIWEIGKMIDISRLPGVTVQKVVENMCMLDILVKVKHEHIGFGHSYKFNPVIVELIRGAEVYESINPLQRRVRNG